MTRVSVLICTHDRARLLAQCLSALLDRSQEKPHQVVVVNGGDEQADDVIHSFADRSPNTADPELLPSVLRPSSSVSSSPSPVEIKLLKTINKNLAASRNVGLPHCTGDIIAMTDDDAQVFPDWIVELKRLHGEHPEAGAIGGSVLGADSDSLISRVADRVTFGSYTKAQEVRTLPGVNVSYKRQVVEQVGAQDETLFRGEDVDYNWRARQFGWTIYYDPRVRVLHHHRPTLRAFLNQHHMYGRAYYLVRRKWPEMYSVYPHGLRSVKDLLKAVNFVAAALYEPLIYAGRMERPTDKIMAYPILLANQMAWRAGMLQEKFAPHQ